MKNTIPHFEQAETIGKFTLWLNRPVFKEYLAGDGFVVKNVKTGEAVGQTLRLYMSLYDDCFRRMPDVVFDEDCYRLAEVKDE